jgi:hypothetical protein
MEKGQMKLARMLVLTIGGLMAVLPATASAATTADCRPPATSTALAPFGDLRPYFVAPGADFETSAWTLAGGATRTTGSGPLKLGAAKSSLRLPSGGSATSPVFCVDLDYPTLRFFSAQHAPKSSSKLSVDVIYPALRQSTPKAYTVSTGTPAWALSRDVRLRPERVDKAGGWRQVQLRFSADKAAAGDWRVDDVLVDPRKRG